MPKLSRVVALSGRVFLAAAIPVLGIAAACSDDSTASSPTPDAGITVTPPANPATPPSSPPPVDPPTPPSSPDSGADGGLDIAHCAGETDPYYDKVLAYIPCTTTIEDTSGNSTIALFNAPTVSATPAGAKGGASCSLGKTGGQNTARGFSITMPQPIGTGDFTVEVSAYQTEWYEPTDQQSEILIGSSAYPPGPGKFPSFFSHAGIDSVQYIGGTAEVSYKDAGGTLSTWSSYAASRIDGTVYVFRDGQLLTSFADATDYTDTVAYVGHQLNGSYNAVMGSVNQIRITGVARYKSGYTACSEGFASQ